MVHPVWENDYFRYAESVETLDAFVKEHEECYMREYDSAEADKAFVKARDESLMYDRETIKTRENFIEAEQKLLIREKEAVNFFKNALKTIEEKLKLCDGYEYSSWCTGDVQVMVLLIMAKQYSTPSSVQRSKTKFEVLAYECFEIIEVLLSGKLIA